MLRKRGLRQGTVTTPDGPAVYGSNTPRHSSERAVLLTLPSRDVQGLAPLAASCQTLNIMEAVIAEVSTQLSEVVGVIERHLEPTLLAVHLYGSAMDGGPEATVILICWLR